jgi:hypothetical protein
MTVRTIRHLSLLVSMAIAAALVVPSMAVLASTQSPAPQPALTQSLTGCTRTVRGFTAAAVESARDRAGVGGTVCFPAGTYRGSLHASVRGQTWKLTYYAALTGAVYISAPSVKITGGSIVRPSGDRWTASVQIRADNVTVKGVRFRGGGTGVGVYGKDRARIASNSFRYLSGSAVAIWSEGVGADYTAITGNSIVQTRTYHVSPITSRGNEGGSHGGVQNYGTVITSNSINQGNGSLGWFGIELKQSRGAIIEHNTIKGGTVLISLPETDAARIRYNTFDLRGSAHWGVEVGNAYDAAIDRNTFIGDGKYGVDYAIILNSGSLRTLARYNHAANLRTFFGVAGDGHRVTDNCLKSVGHLQEFMLNGGPNIIFARNGTSAC